MITRRDWIFIAVANGVSMAIAVLSAIFHWGWLSATLSVAVTLVMLGVFCWRHPEPFFAKVFLFGLAAGWVELINDTWLIRKGLLVYDPGGPFVIDTPLYMPFTWALLFVTTCSVAFWLWQKLGPVRSALVTAVISGMYIPGFEAIADKADWWYYLHVPMLGSAPRFVIASEALLALPLPWMSSRVMTGSSRVALALGVLEGLVIFGTTLIALWVVG